MTDKFILSLSEKLSEEIVSVKPMSGGSISSAYLIETKSDGYFIKINSGPDALRMFHAEQKGLKAIYETGTIAVPRVHFVDYLEDNAVILMDFVESKLPAPEDYRHLGKSLASLHKVTQKDFGFSSDNFIGSLFQSNKVHSDWNEFFWSERLSPQFELAIEKGLLCRKEVPLMNESVSVFNKYSKDVIPSLLHGDLWGGNYLISVDGTPYLIDPAVYYGHSMVDIAMSKLFGSFGSEFYDAYHRIMPKSENYDEEIDFYQLYFLLVHLNMFGSGYYSAVSKILKRYFK